MAYNDLRSCKGVTSMPYNPQIRHRRAIRLKGYDYTSSGTYCRTLCTQSRECILGEDIHGAIILSDIGRTVARSWLWLADHHPYVNLDAWIMMPDHLHGILDNADPRIPRRIPCIGTHSY